MREDEDVLSRDTQRWEEALGWHETLTELDARQLTSALIRDWRAWHGDPHNRRIFDQVVQLTADGCRMASQGALGGATEADHDPVASIAAWRNSKVSSSGTRQRSRRGVWASRAGPVAMVASAAIAALILWPRWESGRALHRQSGSAVYESGIGELKRVHLGDGSEITLGGGTRLQVDLSAATRAVDLKRGEAWFKVAHDPKWPFVVLAGDRTITAVGTAFLVTRDSNRVVVTVTEGTIAVSAPRLPALAALRNRVRAPSMRLLPIRVTRGEEVTYGDNGTMASVMDADTRAATAWTTGRLIFDDEPLRYVIEDVSRYSSRHITGTSAAGELRFSGVILRSKIKEWLQRLPEVLPVDVEERGTRACIRSRVASDDEQCPQIR